MGDRVAVLKRGLLQQVDSPQNLYEHPGNVFVAGFIGSPAMNLMRVTLDGTAEAPTVSIGSNTLAIAPELWASKPALAGYLGKEVVLGVRPEDLEDVAISGDDVPADRRITSEITLVESLGSELIAHFPLQAEPFAIMDAEFEGEDAIEAARHDGQAVYVGRFSPRSRAMIGSPIEIAVDTSRLHFFDVGSGLAIND